MKKHSGRTLILVLLLSVYAVVSFAQNTVTISGKISSQATGESLSAVSVAVKGGTAGTYTDERGNFKLTVSQPFPFVLVISSVGYASKEITVHSANEPLGITLDPSYVLGQAVVVAASRTAERILESPVTIERVDNSTIRNAPAASYYDVIGNLKGVDMTTSSLTFKTISTRGFNGSGNLRFNQLVDGMDNQAPGLNFSVGNIIGLTELDVDNMELLSGASSALYGPGGMNGTLLINSKSPFKYQGVSAQVKQGIMHIADDAQKVSPYYDVSVRWGQKVSNRFAFKLGAQVIKTDDWQARDKRDLERNNVLSKLKPGDRQSDPNYDGVNVFGDEASASMSAFAQAVRAQVGASQAAPLLPYLDAQIAAGRTPQQMATDPTLAPVSTYLPFLIPTSGAPNNAYRNTFGGQNVSRTGYDESALVDYNTYNVKVSGGLYYKLTQNTEVSLTGNWGTGTTVYTGADRYSLKNLKMGQYKLEFKSKNWFARAYTIQENSGDSYTATTAAVAINRTWKNDATWFQQYTGVYGAARLGILPNAFGTSLPDAQAHGAARGVAEQGMYTAGSASFKRAFDSVINVPISKGGAKFADKSALYHFEGQYNLTDYIKFAEVLVGANYRRYVLNSQGTIFADTAGKIGINEYGAYIQVQKQLLKDVLKLTGSVRYDKNENFKARFTPRFTAVVKVAENNNIRLSYQTAYRFPSTQDQWINLLTPSTRLIGGLPSFNTFFNFDGSPAYTAESIVAYRNSIATGTPDPTLLKVGKFVPIKPESVQSFELGYKTLIAEKLLIDAYGYYSRYKDFIGRVAVGRGQSANPNPSVAYQELASPFTTTNYSFVYNVATPVKAYGWGLGLEYKFYRNYLLTGNVYSDKLTDVPNGLVTFFNTPKVRYNIGLGNENVYRNFGFNILFRWQDKIYWEGTFGTGEVPSYSTLDAQISYKIPSIKSMIKLGATNLTNKYYTSAFGNPQIGGLYYISFGYNVF
jgi:outer membrane receptor protein involved in Fe transport